MKYCFLMLQFFVALEINGQKIAESDLSQQKLKVFLDCGFCDKDYLRQEVDYIDYVRDQRIADVHVFFVRNESGSGGRVYDISYIGKKAFEGSVFKMDLTTEKLDTSDEVRMKIKDVLSAGLVPFLYKSTAGYDVEISYENALKPKEQEHVPIRDPWHNWVFEISGQGDFEWESQRKKTEFEYGLEIDHVTSKYRIRQDFFTRSNKRTIQDTIEIKVTRSYYNGRFVRSIDNHWSGGIFTTLEASSFSNIDRKIRASAAVEYNIFPWSEVARKQFTFVYRFGYLYQDYTQVTIHNKLEDLVPIHTLAMEVIFNQPWGSIYGELEASQFANNPERRRLEFDTSVRVRIMRGLSARLSVGYELINDQINLARGDATLEEIISRQREIATDFGSDFDIGLSYTFGSMFNNVVNKRL